MIVHEVVSKETMRGIVSALGKDKKRVWTHYIHVQEALNGKRYMMATNGKSMHYRETDLEPGTYRVVDMLQFACMFEKIEMDKCEPHPRLTCVIDSASKGARFRPDPLSPNMVCGVAGYFGCVLDPEYVALAVGKQKTIHIEIADGDSPVRIWNGLWHSIIMPIRIDRAAFDKLKKEAQS